MDFHLVKKIKLHSCKNTLKAIGNMYTTKAIHSRLAFAKYAKMSVSLQKLRIQKSRAATWCQRFLHLLAEKYTCDSSSRTCMFSENECCYFTGVTMEDFLDDCSDVEYYEWAKVDAKVSQDFRFNSFYSVLLHIWD